MQAASRTYVRDITLALTGDAAELEQRAKARRAEKPATDWMMMIFWIVVVLWLIWVMSRGAQTSSAQRRYGGPVIIPGPGWGGGGEAGKVAASQVVVALVAASPVVAVASAAVALRAVGRESRMEQLRANERAAMSRMSSPAQRKKPAARSSLWAPTHPMITLALG